MTNSSYKLTLTLLFAVLIQWSLSNHNLPIFAQNHSMPNTSPFYEAELEYSQGALKYKYHILVKDLQLYSKTVLNTYAHQIIYRDNNPPHIVWAYNAKKKIAYPDYFSLMLALARIADTKGLEYVLTQYQIPRRSGMEIKSYMARDGIVRSPVAGYGQAPLSQSILTKDQRATLPSEIVAGHECYVDIQESKTDKHSTKFKFWIEKQSGLVLRRETTSISGNTQNPREPSTSNTTKMIVTKFKLHKDIPDSAFQLPPGTIAYYPETMKGLKFPKGVIPKPMTGRTAKSGIDWEEIVAFDKKVRTIPNP